MNKSRVEAFSDGVIAIIITIMVLDMKAPGSADLQSLRSVLPALIAYVLSFVHVGIYWNNHHHVFQAVQRVSGMTLWANLHLLFWLSLVPFTTRWMGDSQFATWPVAIYGANLLLCGLGWETVRQALVHYHDCDSALVRALGSSLKEWGSLTLYGIGIGAAFVNTWFACAVYGVVAAIWVIPDRRIEREMGSRDKRF